LLAGAVQTLISVVINPSVWSPASAITAAADDDDDDDDDLLHR